MPRTRNRLRQNHRENKENAGSVPEDSAGPTAPSGQPPRKKSRSKSVNKSSRQQTNKTPKNLPPRETEQTRTQKSQRMTAYEENEREKKYNEIWRKILYAFLLLAKILIWLTHFKEIDFLRSVIIGFLVGACVSESRNTPKRRQRPKNFFQKYYAALMCIGMFCDCTEMDKIKLKEATESGDIDRAKECRTFVARQLLPYIFSFFGASVAPYHRVLKNNEDFGGAVGGVLGLVLMEIVLKNM